MKKLFDNCDTYRTLERFGVSYTLEGDWNRGFTVLVSDEDFQMMLDSASDEWDKRYIERRQVGVGSLVYGKSTVSFGVDY